MARPKTKHDLMEQAQTGFDKLWQVIDAMTEEELTTGFDFSAATNKKEAHWARDKNLRDVLVHLYEWHQLLCAWIRANSAGKNAAFLPAPYTWKTYGEMNIALWKKHQATPLEDAKQMLRASHDEVLELLQPFTNEELFTKQYFNWTGTTTLGSYCVSTLSSHYDWAIKKLRAHKRGISQRLAVS